MAGIDILPFEKPLHDLRERIDEILDGGDNSEEMQAHARMMQEQADEMERKLYENLSAWNVIQIARHQNRPTARDYIELIFDNFEELHGDRAYRDDLAIVTGLGEIGGKRVMFIGQHRGRNVEERHQSHAGCSHPEGYRKALQKMKLAERFGLPIITLVDTKGAYPGIGAEERGQGIALAENIRDMSLLRVPVICCIIGEGGSGGALAVAVGNRVLMMQHAYYSVISPEGCASILWRDGERKVDAANVLKLTSTDLYERGFIDTIVEEPLGGAHRDPKKAANSLKENILKQLTELEKLSPDELAEDRYQKFRAFGDFLTDQQVPLRFVDCSNGLEEKNTEETNDTTIEEETKTETEIQETDEIEIIESEIIEDTESKTVTPEKDKEKKEEE